MAASNNSCTAGTFVLTPFHSVDRNTNADARQPTCWRNAVSLFDGGVLDEKERRSARDVRRTCKADTGFQEQECVGAACPKN